MNDEVAGKVLDAYRANPILTALLILNVGTFIGMGWYETRNDDRTYNYVIAQNAKMDQLHEKIETLSRQCPLQK